jgi:serine/threonine-protein kinase
MIFQIGQVVGDYEVIGVIGAGGMGSVYKVRNVLSDRIDAMKVLLPDLAGSPDLADRFLNEIKVLASLQHPNIASLHAALRVNNQLLMIMEFVDGGNLDERMRTPAPLPIAEGVSYIHQVLSALDCAHRHGVVHRDIKPANIAINRQAKVKLLDFGIARAVAQQHLTRTGMVLGSLYYMSPEQVRGEPVDARSDLYSVGVTLYRVLTGKRPVEGSSEYAVMRAQVNDIPVPPLELIPSLPAELSHVTMRSLAKSRELRFQSAEDFMRALEPFLARDPVLASTYTMVAPQTGSTVDAAALAVLQKHLAAAMGPIAGPLVRKLSRQYESLPELSQALADQIASPAERAAFLRACARELGAESLGAAARGLSMVTPVPTGSGQSIAAWDPAVLNQVKKLLADYIGPLARVIVDRASKKTQSMDEMFSILSSEIASPKDRERFLAARAGIQK